MSEMLLDRISRLERQVQGIRRELTELRAQAEAAAPTLSGSEPQTSRAPEPREIRPPRVATRVSGSEPLTPPRHRDLAAELRARAARFDRDLSAADLLGAKALEWAGGIVTVLG